MVDKQIIIDGVNVKDCKRRIGKDNYCRYYKRPCAENNYNCIWKKYLRKEQEYEELRQYHNKCCEEFKKEKQNLIDRCNQFSKDFFIGKYCKKEYCDLLKAKEQECEELKKQRQADKGLITSTGKMNYQLIQEYDKLKTENDELKTMLKDLSYENQKFCYQIEEQTKQLEPFKDEYFKGLDNVLIAELAKKSIRITAENSKLKTTITEIKEMLKEICMEECSFDWNKTSKKHCGDCDCRYGQILQKISECEENNDMENN